MADYTSKAQVVLSVNGKQAQQILKTLEKDAEQLRKKMDEAAKIGDKGSMKKLQRELKQTEKQIGMLKGEAKNVDDVLRRLDKASPKELQKTLTALKRELNGIERGSEAWDKQVGKIRQVNAEITRVRQTMQTQESGWSRFNNWLNSCQTAILGIGASITGMVMAGRKSVESYASMEQEMANVRKYTGMTEEEVAALNEEFKKIDTRTSREELNKLAQEAGRLGKTSQEDVLGFVKAADQINVALDDLGDGATLTLSKLTGIFGDEKRLGTEKALLSVGSVINELSQNCSASAPYLAEFASRMGGVGSQAGMTVQQIMAFGAVLDSNQQAVEASATALSQIIVRIYQDPAKYARVAGMDVQKFANLVKTDMNAALLEFLDALNRAGSMDVLSPMFKDMGENGSRAIQAMSTLAQHIGDVRDQQLNANIAFAEATSITNEFNVQNNTVQAGLDKAKNKLNELAVELGQKLMPLMSGAISSSTLVLKALSTIVTYISENKAQAISLVMAITAWTVALNANVVATNLKMAVMKADNILTATTRSLALALSAAYNTLTGNITRATAATKLMNGTMKASIFGVIATAITLVVAKFIDYRKKVNEAAEAQRKLDKEQKEWQEGLRDIDRQSAEYSQKEKARLDTLYNAARDHTKSQNERIAAVNKLKEQYPEYFSKLSTESIMLGQAKKQYDDLTTAIIKAANARAANNKIAELGSEKLDYEISEDKINQEIIKKTAQRDNVQRIFDQSSAIAEKWKNKEISFKEYNEQVLTRNTAMVELRELNEEIAGLLKRRTEDRNRIREISSAQSELSKKYGVDINTAIAGESPSAVAAPPVSNVSAAPSSGASVAEERFKEEKEWRQKSEALAKIFYATGVTNSIEYYRNLDEIAVEYNSKILQREDLTDEERIKIATDFAEAQKAQAKRFTADSVEEENKRYNQSIALLKQYYIDGKISRQAYDDFTLEAEAEHQQTLINLYEEGSDERLKAEDRLNNMLIQQMQKRQEETQKLEQQYAEIKKTQFGLNESERMTAYQKDLSMLDIVYERELAAVADNAKEKLRIEEAYEKAKLELKKKYGLLSAEDYKNAMQKGVADSITWLNSEGGQAVVKSFETITSGMASIFSQLSSLMKAELELQTAEIENRYDKEIKAAEGNSYQVAQLEKKKEAEIAKAKNEANKKMFAIQVIQAVAQTATAALNAYSSAAAIPVTGWIMAPIAAAMAVAAGAIQIASIKKQQAAAAATGYAEGGFTKEGDKYEPVGIVHAGEWVASQKLVKNPNVRPILESLDYAQKTNTYPVMSAESVSMRLNAPSVMAQRMPSVRASSSRLEDTLNKLNARLNEPIYTVNEVAGDKGMQRAKEKYDRLMKNKS